MAYDDTWPFIYFERPGGDLDVHYVEICENRANTAAPVLGYVRRDHVHLRDLRVGNYTEVDLFDPLTRDELTIDMIAQAERLRAQAQYQQRDDVREHRRKMPHLRRPVEPAQPAQPISTGYDQPQAQGSGGLGNFLGWLVLICLIIALFYVAGIKYSGPKVIIRGITKDFLLPAICTHQTQDLSQGAQSIFGTNVDIADLDSIEGPMLHGKCLDGIIVKGAKLKAVYAPAAMLIKGSTFPPSLPGLPDSGCIDNVPGHPGELLCTNVGPYDGDVTLIADGNLFVYYLRGPPTKPPATGDPTPEPQPTPSQ
jgi:hypothetical protein